MEQSGEGSIYAKLAEIAGGVKLIDTKLDASNRVHDERHAKVQEDIHDLRQRSHRHSNDIQGLQGWKSQLEGERKGVAVSGRVIWAIVSLIIGGTGMFGLMKLFGG